MADGGNLIVEDEDAEHVVDVEAIDARARVELPDTRSRGIVTGVGRDDRVGTSERAPHVPDRAATRPQHLDSGVCSNLAAHHWPASAAADGCVKRDLAEV